jgi:hypothetical protein
MRNRLGAHFWLLIALSPRFSPKILSLKVGRLTVARITQLTGRWLCVAFVTLLLIRKIRLLLFRILKNEAYL